MNIVRAIGQTFIDYQYGVIRVFSQLCPRGAVTLSLETRNKNEDDKEKKEREEKMGGKKYRRRKKRLRQSDERQCRRKKGSVCAEAEVIAEIARLLFLLCARTQPRSPTSIYKYKRVYIYIYV